MVWYEGKAGGRMKLREMTHCGVFAAVLAVCAWLSFPFGGLMVSLQSFGVLLALGLLGGRCGTVTVLVYLLLGAAGAPVFSGFRGGISALLGPTGGYLWGFLAACAVYWILERRLPRWLNMALGMVVCYICGTAWYYYMHANGALWPVVLTCVVPYLLPDALKLILSLSISKKIKSLLR